MNSSAAGPHTTSVSAGTRLTENFGLLHSPVLLSHTVFSAPAPTTAKLTVPVQILQDHRRETDPSASDSTGPQGVLQVPVRSSTSAAIASPLPTPSSTAQTASPGAPNDTTSPSAPVTAARNKVELIAKNYSPRVTTPIDVDVLERELDGHPDRNFVNTRINSLRYGTHVSYTGPHKPRVSRNLISANQQPMSLRQTSGRKLAEVV